MNIISPGHMCTNSLLSNGIVCLDYEYDSFYNTQHLSLAYLLGCTCV